MMRTWLRSNRGFLVFLCCFGLFRTAVADWNPIPSGSMRPNLLEGDVVLVNRLAYDLKVPLTDTVLVHLGDPRRGDIVTFSSPADGTRLIKRIIGVPGDRIEMREEVLYVNGQPSTYVEPEALQEAVALFGPRAAVRLTERTASAPPRRVQWLEGIAARRSFEAIEVPPGQYLMLGDNRDNSADSRYFGLVPRERLIGRAHRVLVSADIQGAWRPRLERFGMALR